MKFLSHILCAMMLLAAPAAMACAFHALVVPDSLVDKLIASDRIVLARPDPKEPYRFEIVASLDGPSDNIEIPDLVASSERRRLMSNLGDTVLFARGSEFEKLRRVGYIKSSHRQLVEQIAKKLPNWRAGDDSDRAMLFAAYPTDDDPLIRSTALVELARLPYRQLRELDVKADVDRLLSRLPILSEHNLVPIRVQLLGMSKDPRALYDLVAGFDAAVRAGSPNVAYYATALIELDGARAVQELHENYLADPDWQTAARSAILDAMALQARAGDPEVSVALRNVIRDVLVTSPELVPGEAQLLGSRSGGVRRGGTVAGARSVANDS